METIEHFAKISLVARLLGGENLISREEVERLQGLRGMYGIAAPAPLCADPVGAAGMPTTRSVQVLEAPESHGRTARAATSTPCCDRRAGTGKFG